MRQIASEAVKKFAGQAVSEGIEESTDELMGSVVDKLYHKPDLTLRQALSHSVESFGWGAFLGGTMNLPTITGRAIGDTAAMLADKGAPLTAEAVESVKGKKVVKEMADDVISPEEGKPDIDTTGAFPQPTVAGEPEATPEADTQPELELEPEPELLGRKDGSAFANERTARRAVTVKARLIVSLFMRP